MTPAQIGAQLEADMRAAVLEASASGLTMTAADASAVKTFVDTAAQYASAAMTTPGSIGRVPQGFLSFSVPVNYASVTNVTVRLRVNGSSTVAASLSLGKPTADVYGVVIADVSALYAGQPADNYQTSVAMTYPSGVVDSGLSPVFSLPLTSPVAVFRTVGPGKQFATVQAAVNAAAAGDTLVLDAGVTFTESVTLPNKGVLASPITITTSADPQLLPATGRRTNPSYAALLPKIVSPGSGQPCLIVAPSANNYTLRHLEFPGVPLGFNAIIKIGAADSTQQFKSDEPHHIIVDQCYLHGGEVCGQKRGIESHGRFITISNCYIDDIKSVGQDSQSISGLNGHGPLTITNNFLRGGTEPILIGGGDPTVRTFMTITSGASATGANVTCSEAGHTLSELVVGQALSVQVGGVWVFTTIATITGTGTAGALTWATVGGVPDTPGGLRAGVILGMEGPGFGLTVQRNLIGNDPAWLDGVLPAPVNVTAVGDTISGALGAGTHYFTVQSFNPNGYQASPTNWVNSNESREVSVKLATTGKATVSWTLDPNATIYRVWHGTTPGARTQYHDATTSPFVYDGTGVIADTPVGATRWQIKNLLEIKAAQNVQIDSNIFQYAWKGNSTGYACWLKSVNQDGTGSYLQSKNLVVEKNIWRHCDGALEVHGHEVGTAGFGQPGPLTNLTYRHNLVYDSQVFPWGEGSEVYAFNLSNDVANMVIQHNTIVHLTNGTGGGLMTLDPPPTSGLMTGFAFVDNMVRRETFGTKASGFASGLASLNAVTSGGYTYSKNAIADSSAGVDGAPNFYEVAALWEAEFVNYKADGVGADFHLKPTSTYHNVASDGIDVGADVTTILSVTALVATG